MTEGLSKKLPNVKKLPKNRQGSFQLKIERFYPFLKICQILPKILSQALKSCQNGDISPNLVPLLCSVLLLTKRLGIQSQDLEFSLPLHRPYLGFSSIIFTFLDSWTIINAYMEMF